MSIPWSQIEQHLSEYKMGFEYKNILGTNAYSVEAWNGAGPHQIVRSSAGDSRFAEADLRDFFRALHIAFPSWL